MNYPKLNSPIKDPSQDGFLVSTGAASRKGSFFGSNNMNGWIKLHRSIIDHWIFKDEKKLKWWIYLLAIVNHEFKKVLIKNTLVDCDRGQTIVSLETLSLKWLVTKKTVKTFLELLQSDDMIRIENIKISTRITVCNYDNYQESVNGKETERKRQVNATETPSKRDLPTNKNIKNDKEGKEVYTPAQISGFKTFIEWIDKNAPRVSQMKQPFTISEYINLLEDYKNKNQVADLLKAMHNYQPLLTKNINANLTFRNWMKREPLKTMQKTEVNPMINGKAYQKWVSPLPDNHKEVAQ